ncbi:hypothetical protein FQA39_LY06118 [Lamprigera yunnana]|nr:hypothetical protein FQA39_LY06118 [Lamprigera yunnana]
MDGIGGVLKLTADKQVRLGKGIRTADDFVNLFLNSIVEVLQISSCDIEAMKMLISKNIDAIPGIIGITKITWKKITGYVVKLFQNEVFRRKICLKSLEPDQNELETIPTIYQAVYGSDDDDLHTCLRDERNNFENGSGTSILHNDDKKNVHPNLIHHETLLIEVPTANKNKYIYAAALADTIVEEDGDVEVTFLKSTGTESKTFAVAYKDVWYISY